jgi:hypothetical protein
MVVGVKGAKDETGDDEEDDDDPSAPVCSHEQMTGVTAEVPRRETVIHEPPLHTLLSVLIGIKSDHGVRSVVIQSVNGEGTKASTKLATSPDCPSPCPDATPP